MENRSSMGLAENIANVVVYALGWISGLVVLLIEKDSARVRFHAAQSVTFFGGCMLLSWVLPIIPVVGPIAVGLLGIIALLVWVAQLVLSFMGKPLALPVIEALANKLTLKVAALSSSSS
jgi:uncharacterized membrane protein